MKKRILALLIAFSLFLCTSPTAFASDAPVIEPTSMNYTLRDSTYHSEPSYAKNQNCYGYALDKIERPSPGSYSDQTYSQTGATIEQFAALVEDDLAALGYSCIQMSQSCPSSSSLSSTDNLICIRRSHPAYLQAEFHFMKYIKAEDVWRHKPGIGAILTYNYTPSTGRDWLSEGIIDGEAREGPEMGPPGSTHLTYTGKIYYFIFNTTHSSTTRYTTGSHYHSGARHYYQYRVVCNTCGTTEYVWESTPCSGPPCLAPRDVTLQPELS